MDDNGWLVLTRKEGEDIWIGDDVCIRVNEIRGGKVRLMFKAPTSTRIDRAEVRREMAEDYTVRFDGSHQFTAFSKDLAPHALLAVWCWRVKGWAFRTARLGDVVEYPIGYHWLGVALAECAESIGAAARVGR